MSLAIASREADRQQCPGRGLGNGGALGEAYGPVGAKASNVEAPQIGCERVAGKKGF